MIYTNIFHRDMQNRLKKVLRNRQLKNIKNFSDLRRLSMLNDIESGESIDLSIDPNKASNGIKKIKT